MGFSYFLCNMLYNRVIKLKYFMKGSIYYGQQEHYRHGGSL